MQRPYSFFLKIYLSILFLAVVGLHCYGSFPLLWRVGATRSQVVKASHCDGFCGAWALEHASLSSYDEHA